MRYSPLIRKIILDLTWKYVSSTSDVPEGRRWIRTNRGAILYKTSTKKNKNALPNGDNRIYSSNSDEYIEKLYEEQVKFDNISRYDDKDEEYNLILETDPEITKYRMEFEHLLSLFHNNCIKEYYEYKGWDISNTQNTDIVPKILNDLKEVERKYDVSTSKIRGLIKRNQSAKRKALIKGDNHHNDIRSSIPNHTSELTPKLGFIGPTTVIPNMRDLYGGERDFLKTPLDKVTSYIQTNMHESVWKDLNICIKYNSDRPAAYYSLKNYIGENINKRTGIIMLNDNFVRPPNDSLFALDVGGTIMHEIGHAIEDFNPKIHEIALKFFTERTKNQPLEEFKLGSETYHCKPDHFPKKYCGRIYSDGNNSEIVSMGLEMMMVSPGSFLERDPEYFQLIYDIMQGEYND